MERKPKAYERKAYAVQTTLKSTKNKRKLNPLIPKLLATETKPIVDKTKAHTGNMKDILLKYKI
jgi:hypothetical protein